MSHTMSIKEALDFEHLLTSAAGLKLTTVSERLQKNLAEWSDKLRLNYEITGFRAPENELPF